MSNTAKIVNIQEHRPAVKADIDNGFDRLAHDITDTLALNPAKLSGCEFQVVHALIAKTYRWHKKEDWIANSQICEITGMNKAHVSRTIKSLISKNVLRQNGKNIGINPVVSDWGVTQLDNNKSYPIRQPELPDQTTEVIQSGNKSYPIRPPQKKETITKETNTKERREKTRLSIPENLPAEAIKNFIADRSARKMKMTERAINLFIGECQKAADCGLNVSDLINKSILNGWKTIYIPDNLKAKQSQFKRSESALIAGLEK